MDCDRQPTISSRFSRPIWASRSPRWCRRWPPCWKRAARQTFPPPDRDGLARATRPGDREIVWHNRGTGGYRSFVGYDRNAGLGVVVLSNTSTPVGVDDIGMDLLDPRAPLFTPPPPRTAVTPTQLCSTGVGRHELAPNFILTITREDARLFAQATGQGRSSSTRKVPGTTSRRSPTSSSRSRPTNMAGYVARASAVRRQDRSQAHRMRPGIHPRSRTRNGYRNDWYTHWRARAFGCATTAAVNVLAAEAAPENPCPACAKTAQDKGDHRGSAFEWHFAETRSSRIQTAVRMGTGPARGDRLVVERWANNALAVTAKLVPFSRHFNVVLVGKIHAELLYRNFRKSSPGNLTSAQRSTGQGSVLSLRCWPK